MSAPLPIIALPNIYRKETKVKLTKEEADKILEIVSGSKNPTYQKIDELICAIQSKEEIEYIKEDN